MLRQSVVVHFALAIAAVLGLFGPAAAPAGAGDALATDEDDVGSASYADSACGAVCTRLMGGVWVVGCG